MKQTVDDKAFAKEFSRKLKPFYNERIKSGGSRKKRATQEAFAAELGVTWGALQKYLDATSTPALRTVVLAYKTFGILIPYAGVRLKKIMRAAKKPDAQLLLPLAIDTRNIDIDIESMKKSPQKIDLKLRIKGRA